MAKEDYSRLTWPRLHWRGRRPRRHGPPLVMVDRWEYPGLPTIHHERSWITLRDSVAQNDPKGSLPPPCCPRGIDSAFGHDRSGRMRERTGKGGGGTRVPGHAARWREAATERTRSEPPSFEAGRREHRRECGSSSRRAGRAARWTGHGEPGGRARPGAPPPEHLAGRRRMLTLKAVRLAVRGSMALPGLPQTPTG